LRKTAAFAREKEKLRNETAAYAYGILTEAFGPQTLEADPDGRQDGNVEDGEQRFRNAFGGREVERDAAEAEVYDSGALDRPVGENGIGIGAGH